jgi:nitrile hydratase
MQTQTVPAFKKGDEVRIRADHPQGHHRTPWFIKGKTGVVDDLAGAFVNPETHAYGESGLPRMPLYRVRFNQSDIWQDYGGNPHDTLFVDVFQHWLEQV